MNKETVILLAEDDMGHAGLIIKNLERAGITNEIVHFTNGQEVLDHLFSKSLKRDGKGGSPYVLLLDIRMPKVDGIEVLRRIKADKNLRSTPVIMVTTTDEEVTINMCYEMGCSSYIVKPVDYDEFVNMINNLGIYLKMIRLPS